MQQDIRWKQRFQNFSRAVELLREANEMNKAGMSDLEKQGMIQRFEMVLDLAWKTLRDFLLYQGRVVWPVTPRNVIKEAFEANILPDGHVWIEMIDHRNLLSHTYDQGAFDEAITAIGERYFIAIDYLSDWFAKQLVES